MSDDMLELAGSYAFIRDAAYPDSDCFFPSPDGRAYPSSWYQNHLKRHSGRSIRIFPGMNYPGYVSTT